MALGHGHASGVRRGSTPRAARVRCRGLRALAVATLGVAFGVAFGVAPGIAVGSAVATRASALPGLHQVAGWVAAGLKDEVATAPIEAQLTGNPYAWVPNSPCLTAAISSTNATPCVLGDTSSATTVVLYGDSSADEWALDLGSLAALHDVRLVVYVRAECPVGEVGVELYGLRPDPSCPAFRSHVLSDLARMRPAPVLVLVSELRLSNYEAPTGRPLANSAWSKGLTKTLVRLEADHLGVAVLHGLPITPTDPASCIAANPTAMARCAVPHADADPNGYDAATWAGARAARAAGADVTPLFCTAAACPVVANGDVTHSGDNHVTERYAGDVTAALAELVGCVVAQPFVHRSAAARTLDGLLGGTPQAAVLRACRALHP